MRFGPGTWAMSSSIGAGIAALVAAWMVPASVSAGEAAAAARLSVLVVSTLSRERPKHVEFERGLDLALGFKSGRADVFFESFDNPRIAPERAAAGLAALIERKYGGHRFDVVVAWGMPPARLFAAHRDLVGSACLLFLELSDEEYTELGARASGAVALVAEPDYQASLGEALRITGAKRIVVVGDGRDRSAAARLLGFQQGLAAVSPETATDYILDRPLDEVIERTAALPSRSMIYYLLAQSDGRGNNMSPFEFARRFAPSANAPVFAPWENLIGSGVVGGTMMSVETAGRAVGEFIAGARCGAASPSRDLTQVNVMRTVYDWRQMQRWGWREGRLPPGARIIDRPPGLLDLDRRDLLAVALFIVALATLTAVLARVLRARNHALVALTAERAALAERVRERDSERAARTEQRNFLTMVSHEFRTPLATIEGATSVLPLLVPADNAAATEVTDKIRRAVRRLIGLVDTCLADDWLDSAMMSLTPRSADLVRLIVEICDEKRLLGGAGRFVLGLPGECRAEIDPTLITVAFSNLIDNALKYSPANASIEIGLASAADETVFSVADHGPGIAPEDRDHIFEKFYRASGSGRVSGAGLGLYLVHRIVALHGGRITLDSRPGEGTTFRIHLPSGGG